MGKGSQMRKLLPSSCAWGSDDRGGAWAVIMLVGVLSANCSASAQDALPNLPDVTVPCAPDVTENRRQVVEQDGQSGVWFHIEVARCMLGRLAALPLYAQRVSLLEDRLRLGDERTVLLRRQAELAEAEAEEAAGALEAATRLARTATESAQRERDLRWLWFGIGVVIVVALEALAIWALSEVRIVI